MEARRGTDEALIGRQATITFGDEVLVVTIDSLDLVYPKTAYAVSWTKADNPSQDIKPGCAGKCSVIHYSQIVSIMRDCNCKKTGGQK